jgi:hypothetical protein
LLENKRISNVNDNEELAFSAGIRVRIIPEVERR